MYNKVNSNYNKRRIYNYEDEAPEKKLISDGDIFIKQLSEKQRNTQVNLQDQLSSKSQFYKSTEVVPITSYTSGSNSLEQFNSIIKRSNDVEAFKSSGLTDQDIELIFDYRTGTEHMKRKHKNMNESALLDQLDTIFHKIERSNCVDKKATSSGARLKSELTLATKPRSVETKLLKFALENKQTLEERLPGPMDQIKDVEQRLFDNLSPVNIKKIRRKARSLTKQIDKMNNSVMKPPTKNEFNPNKLNFLGGPSQWDVREPEFGDAQTRTKDRKLFTCKTQNYYTIKDGQIVKINQLQEKIEDVKNKLSVEEIKKIPRFKDYEKGTPSKVLYLKNLANGVGECELKTVFDEFSKHIVSVNVMKGRMQGQAFIELEDEETAGRALDHCNGICLKNKPLIVQFGKRKCS